MFVAFDDWHPQGVESLEPAAESAVRLNDVNQLVVAGPGAGKTELLAQKACYLLQTGLCRPPYRILAVSFKRDAAKNLKDRVQKRCAEELASRFDSYTFDSLSKGLIDRFVPAVPAWIKPTDNYEIDFSLQNVDGVRDLLIQLPPRENLSNTEIHMVPEQGFERQVLCRHPLSGNDINENTIEMRAARAAWIYLIREQCPSRLTFGMIARLVELLLQSNPYISKALRSTYQYVFLDEFQDTTAIQYSLTKNCFLNSSTRLTAVGDEKQKIMGWAGALDHIFNKYTSDFSAREIRLMSNFRSAPLLISIQHVIANALEPNVSKPIVPISNAYRNGECRLLRFRNFESEAQYIATSIHNWISVDALPPREICVICRNRPDRYTETLQQQLSNLGISARIESELQDVLSEPITILFVAILRLAFIRTAQPESWEVVENYFMQVKGNNANESTKQTEAEISKMLGDIRKNHPYNGRDIDIDKLLSTVMLHLNRSVLTNIYPQYRQGSLLDSVLKNVKKYLKHYADGSNWEMLIDRFEGRDTVPIMTIHKSKGLEYHSIIFIGLEDAALWGFQQNPTEETCGFFVALSRAKQRILFTFSEKRLNNWGVLTSQTNIQLGPIYSLLSQAGVQVEIVS